MDNIGVLYTNRSHSGNHEFRFEGYHVSIGYDVAAAGGDNRELVDLDAESVAHEACFLTVAHEILLEAGFHGHSFSEVV